MPSPSHFRCLVDGRSDDTSSAFITPRPREDVLRFQIDVFRFAGDARNLVRLHVPTNQPHMKPVSPHQWVPTSLPCPPCRSTSLAT